MKGRRLDVNSPLPRYYQIYSALLSMMKLGDLAVGEALPPERQIAESFGVSRPTVVKALDLLAREGRIEKQQGRGNIVLEPIASEDVAPKTIAFISSPSLTYDLMMGISQMAFEHDYQLQIVAVDTDSKALDSYLEACVDNGVQGFLVYGRSDTRDIASYERLMAQGLAVVMVDRYYPDLACDHVVYNNEESCYQLVQKLLDRGHQQIAIVPGFELETTSVQDRLSGYRRALETSDIPYDEDLVWLGLYNQRSPSGVTNESYQVGLRDHLERFKPTALITINDLVADYVIHDLLVIQSSLMRSALEGDAEFSEFDLELASFNNLVRADSSYLSVVAVHPTLQLGRSAAKLLIDQLETPHTEIKHLTLPMEVVECSGRAKALALERG